MQRPFIGAYWGIRQESLDQCADRCLAFMQALSVDRNLSTWFKKGKSKKAAVKNPIKLARDDIRDNMTTNNRETDGTPIAELGFRFSAWNGNASSPAEVSVTCGAHSPLVSNVAVLRLPPLATVDPEALDRMRVLLEASVAAWNPDHAIVISSAWLSEQGGNVEDATGWLNYRRGGTITSG